MKNAIDETRRRRAIQEAFNAEHGITPETIKKAIRKGLDEMVSARRTARDAIRASEDAFDLNESIGDLEKEMFEAAEALDFERAARLRDRIKELKDSPMLSKSK